ncbi:Lecithin:cholesterol acyltransferase-domain-containing protein [Parasitella parasitica]|nr:Lecithin:cholesterol acyltransferase-domain-containing protein [Parasitella parasitica]
MLLKKRQGFKFASNESHMTTSVDKVLRYTSSSSNSSSNSNSNSKQEQPEDILADSIIFQFEKPPIWKRKRFHFIIGLSVGLIAAYGASTTPVAQTHLNDLQSYLSLQLSEMDWERIMPVTDMVDELFGNVTNFFTPTPSTDQPFMPALEYRETLDLKPHFPVVLIPGIISSGLESWGTLEKSKRFFRKRMWGTTTMFRSVLLDKELWTEHLKLDPVTGLDPPGIKIRAAQGLDAADYFVTGYWIWAKIIENLAYIGYDNNNMHLASYDWRLSFSNLEIRDQYFSKLQSMIEISKKSSGVSAVIVTHSMGSSMFPYFLRWVQSPEGGNGGNDWTEKHIASFVNIAGPMVGVPKALTAMLSGETRDTMSLGSFGAYLLEKFFSRRERASLMRTWSGGSSMLLKGGETIWGNQTFAPDDEANSQQHSFGSILSFTKTSEGEPTAQEKDQNHTAKKMVNKDIDQNFSANESMELLYSVASPDYSRMLRSNYSFGITTSKKQLEKNNNDSRKWSNPLESQLPIAPSMKIYCLYGVGLPTERGYYYTKAKDDISKTHADCDTDCEFDVSALLNGADIKEEEFINAVVQKSIKESGQDDKHSDESMPQSSPIYIDGVMHEPARGVEMGVRFADGDGTVPVLSLGFMCAPSGGWTKHANLYNPGRSPVLLKEYLHEQSDSKLDVRGGSRAGDHVDILGNWEMTLDILQIVSNKGKNITERIFSNIEQYAQKINIKPLP